MALITNDTGAVQHIEHLKRRTPALPPIRVRNKDTNALLVLTAAYFVVRSNTQKIVDASTENAKIILTEGGTQANLQMSQADWDALPDGQYPYEYWAVSGGQRFSVLNGTLNIKTKPR